MKIIDVTGTIENGMWGYDAPVHKVKIETPSIDDLPMYKGHRALFHRITISTLSGTYLETSAHLFRKGSFLDEVPVERMICNAAVLRLPKKKKPAEYITEDDLIACRINVKPREALLVDSGWHKMWNKDNFVSGSPHFSEEAMKWILDKNISILGADMPVFDHLYQPKGFLLDLFRKGCMLLAPLVNLSMISQKRVKLVALPLKVKGVCGAPCRAIVIEE